MFAVGGGEVEELHVFLLFALHHLSNLTHLVF